LRFSRESSIAAYGCDKFLQHQNEACMREVDRPEGHQRKSASHGAGWLLRQGKKDEKGEKDKKDEGDA
jgi:hypothetical protein